jgi:pyruvate formate lyase activating enzyme
MGMIFNIQEFAVNDGEGIRTTVFLKGCPLSCKWCSNPEGQLFIPDLFHNKNLCQKCLECFKSCPYPAISKDENGYPVFKREICAQCTTFECIENCTSQGIKILGEEISAKKLFDEILTNQLFFRNSEGGVTLSGGEPLAQVEFIKEFLDLCERNGISVGVETCGLFNWNAVKNIMNKFEFIFYDLKCINPVLHHTFTGTDNKIIINNLENLSEILSEKIIISVPVIPGFNDNEEVVDEIINFCSIYGLSNARLIPYHNLGESKYPAIGRIYEMPENLCIDNGFLENTMQKFVNSGIKCRIE